jgi:group I intron endonuclease
MKNIILKSHWKHSGIYCIKSNLSDKVYIGSAVNLGRRFRQHHHELIHGKHTNPKLQNAYNKYGANNIEFSLVELCNEDKLIEREQFYIDSFNCVENGYNINPVAGSQLGFKFSDEAKKRMSAQAKKRMQCPVYRMFLGTLAKGRKISQTQIEIVRKHNTGKVRSEETKQKLRVANAGQKPTEYCIQRSIEVNRKRIRTEDETWRKAESMKRAWDSPDYARKRKLTTLTCLHCSNSFDGYPDRLFCSKSCCNRYNGALKRQQ